LLAHTLRYLCLLTRVAAGPRPRTKYLVVYWAGCYALLHARGVQKLIGAARTGGAPVPRWDGGAWKRLLSLIARAPRDDQRP